MPKSRLDGRDSAVAGARERGAIGALHGQTKALGSRIAAGLRAAAVECAMQASGSLIAGAAWRCEMRDAIRDNAMSATGGSGLGLI